MPSGSTVWLEPIGAAIFMNLPPVIQPTSSPRASRRWLVIAASWTLAVVAMIILVLSVSGTLPGQIGLALACTCAGSAVLLAAGYCAFVRRRLSLHFHGIYCGDVEAAQSPLLFWGMLVAMSLFGLFFFTGGSSYLLGEKAWQFFLSAFRHDS